MMNKRLKQGSTFLLAVALTFPLLTLPGAKAASAIPMQSVPSNLTLVETVNF